MPTAAAAAAECRMVLQLTGASTISKHFLVSFSHSCPYTNSTTLVLRPIMFISDDSKNNINNVINQRQLKMLLTRFSELKKPSFYRLFFLFLFFLAFLLPNRWHSLDLLSSSSSSSSSFPLRALGSANAVFFLRTLFTCLQLPCPIPFNV